MHDIRGFIPEPFEQPGTLLYIGYREDACAWLQELADAGNEITVLEIWPHNVTSNLDDERVSRFVVGDARQVADSPALEPRYDYVFWWHGPEHVQRGEWAGLKVALAGKARKLLAVAAPWGNYPQGHHQGNPHEVHQWSVYEGDLDGMEIKTDGTVDQPGSEIVGVVRR